MTISRSTYYDAPVSAPDDTAVVEAITAICDEFEYYGWRRVQAGLRQQGMIVNHKKIKRLMREHDLQPRMRRRYVATTDSDHDQPIFPNLAKDMTVDGPDQLWVSDEDALPFAVDTIEYRGKLWLVPEWLRGRIEGTWSPTRIICVDVLSLTKAEPEQDADFVLTTPLSRSVLEGRAVTQDHVVIEGPDISLREDTDFLSDR